MDLSKYSIEELRNQMNGFTFQIDMITNSIDRLRRQQQDLCDNELEYQTEIDKRELSLIVDAPFSEQLEYFLTNHDLKRSLLHNRSCDKFFDMLALRVNSRDKSVRFKAHPDFIKANLKLIAEYLPRVLMFCQERTQLETSKYHMIRIENNKMVERINYYPSSGIYFTDGVYIRNHKTIESVLQHLMEEE